jgi:hypothetical protein
LIGDAGTTNVELVKTNRWGSYLVAPSDEEGTDLKAPTYENNDLHR